MSRKTAAQLDREITAGIARQSLPSVGELVTALHRINRTVDTTGPFGERTDTDVRLDVWPGRWQLVTVLGNPQPRDALSGTALIPGYGRRFAARRVASELLAEVRRRSSSAARPAPGKRSHSRMPRMTATEVDRVRGVSDRRLAALRANGDDKRRTVAWREALAERSELERLISLSRRSARGAS